MMRSRGVAIASICLIAVLAACGGGGGGTSGTTYTVGGTVSGLGVSGLVLQNNGGDDTSVSADGTFTFAAALADGAAYSVTAKTQPSGQTCTVANGSGTVAGGNVTNVAVTCAWNAPKTELVSRSTDSSVFSTRTTSEFPVITADGRYVAFVSSTPNLAAGATNGFRQIFVHDRLTHETTLVSVNDSGTEGNNNSFSPSITDDGRYVSFESDATNLVSGDTNSTMDVFLRDLQAGTTIRASVGAGGVQGNAKSCQAVLSANGAYLAFASYASNLTGGVAGTSTINAYLRNLQTQTNTLISADSGGTGIGGQLPAISADGSRIAFWSFASALVSGDSNGVWDIFLYDAAASPKIRLVSVASNSVQRNQGNESTSRVVAPAISGDGKFVAYSTTADNLVSGDTNGLQDVFVFDTVANTTVRASVGSTGAQASGGDSPVGQGERVALSYDGTWVAFTTAATNIADGGSNVLVHNNTTGATVAITASATQASGDKGPAISSDGRYVAFVSEGQLDPRFASSGVFVHDRSHP